MMRSILPLVAVSAVLANSANAEFPEKVRTSIDQITGTKGAYTAEEDVHRLRADADVAHFGLDLLDVLDAVVGGGVAAVGEGMQENP